MSDELDRYMGSIIDEKQLDGVDEAVRVQLIEDMKARYADVLDRTLIAALPDDKVEGFSQLIDTDADATALQQYFIDAGVDVQGITTQTLIKFRELYLR